MSKSLISRMRNLSVALLSDGVEALGLTPEIVEGVSRLAGTSTTTVGRLVIWEGRRVRQTDNPESIDRLRLEAFADIKRGDFVLICPNEDASVAYFGDVTATVLRRFGAVGVVVQGPVRDIASIKQMQFPTWCKSTDPRDAFGRWAITRWVRTNGFLVADADGAIILDPLAARDAVEQAEKRQAAETRVVNLLKRGHGNLETLYDDIGRW